MKRYLLFLLILWLPRWVFAQLNITAATNFTTAGNVHLVLTDMDFINNGSAVMTASTLHFTGMANSVLNTATGFIDLQNFTINKTKNAQLALNASLFLKGELHFISGNIDLKSKTIYLDSTGYFNGESETSRAFSSTGSGLITASKRLNAPNDVNIANLGGIITAGWNMGNVTVSRSHHSLDVTGAGSKSITRSFEFNTSTPTKDNVLLTFNYFDAELNGLNENNLALFQTQDNTHYANLTYTRRDTATNYVSKTVNNMLSKFTLSGSTLALLPITLLDFTAQCESYFVRLNWRTATEINCDHFDIQRSSNGTTWERIASVKSKGNGNNLVTYQYDDKTLNAATAFYRLTQYDLDSKMTYSPILKAGCGQSTEFTLRPNPVIDIAKVILVATSNSKGSLILYNSSGQKLMQQLVTVTNGINQYQIDMSAMAKGNYNLSFIQIGGESKIIKIIKQ